MLERTYTLHGDMDGLSQTIQSGLAEKYTSFACLDETLFQNQNSKCLIKTYQIYAFWQRANLTINIVFYSPDLSTDALTAKVSVIPPYGNSLKGKRILKEMDQLIQNHTA